MRLVLIALFIMMVARCTDKTRVPADILPKDKMRDIMWDLMQVNEYAQNYLSKDTLKNYKKERTVLYQQVFNLHEINKSEFNKSLDYYMSRPDLTQAIFDTLAARQARHREKEMRLKAVQDSIRIKRQEQRAKLTADSARKDSARIIKARRDSLLFLRSARTGHAPR